MPLQLPNLDDRTFEQLLEEAKRRIPVYTPEWTNFDIDSDPGITLVEVFAFLTESLLYRANRIPERDRLKFLQLLGIPLKEAAAARGVVVIRHSRGPRAALPLDPGIVVTAGNVGFLTLDGVNALPVEMRAYFKKQVQDTDPRHSDFQTKYVAILTALEAAGEATASETTLGFYETEPMPQPLPGNPDPVLDLKETLGHTVYLALLAPEGILFDTAAEKAALRGVLANQVLSIGIAPAQDVTVPPLQPVRVSRRAPLAGLIYEIADAAHFPNEDRYARLTPIRQADVLNEVGVVQVVLPDGANLTTWDFSQPLTEGSQDYPPRIEDDRVRERIITWLRIRLPQESESGGGQNGAQIPSARLRWLDVNATRVQQAIPVVNQSLGSGSGEPDQSVTLTNTPVLEDSLRLFTRSAAGEDILWRRTDDLLAAGPDDRVFLLDPESGQIRFGDGLRGVRPGRDTRLFATYQYGGGVQGNVGIGAIKASPDIRLQGGYRIENPIPTWGGDRGETQAEGEKNIPLYLRHRDRLVTAQDFRDITRRAEGVDIGRVEILPLFHPDDPTNERPGVVTVMVIPKDDSKRPLWPTPDRQFLRAVCDYLDERRLVTTEIYVRGPVYVPLYVSVGVQIQDGYFRDTVLQAVTKRLNLYLSSLPPGGIEEQGWPLHRRLLAKDLEAVVTRVPGVAFVEDLLLSVEGNKSQLSGLELPRLAALSVVEGTPTPLSALTEKPRRTDVPDIVPVPISKAKC